MQEFKNYMNENYPFDEFIKILQENITKQNEVEKYLLNGVYIDGSLFTKGSKEDIFWGKRMTNFFQNIKILKAYYAQKKYSD